MKRIGDGHVRLDGVRKVTGSARYSTETPVEGVAHGWLITSTSARGRIVKMDVSKAKSAPGVLAVITPDNAPKLPPPPAEAKKNPVDKVLPLLQDHDVHYDRQVIGIVVADTLDRARHAASLVDVQYQAEGGVTCELEANLASAEPPKEKAKMQKDDGEYARGDADKSLAAAPVKLEATYTTPFEAHNPMEPHATIAVWQGDASLTLYDSTQGIFEARRKVAATLGLKKEQVRVVSHFVGGGFGSKGSVWSHVVLTAMAARVVGRPVKLAIARTQMFGPVGFRPQTRQVMTLGANKDGKLVAIKQDAMSTTSRYDDWMERVTAPTRTTYACDHVMTRQKVVRIDTGTPTFMRAPGEVTGNFAMECALDELAIALEMDPLALRLKNHADIDPETKKPWSSKSLKECYTRAAAKFGWAKRKPEPRSMREGSRLIGWGMATATYPTHVRDASALARLLPDGSLLVQAGSQDIGTGTYTIMAQIAADALSLPVDRVTFELGDTEMPETPTSGGSMTAATVGSAVRRACESLRRKVIELALADAKSPLHGTKADDLLVENGRIALKSDPKKGDDYGALLTRNGLKNLEEKAETKSGEGDEKYAKRSFGASFVEVQVDADLGSVRVTRAVGAWAAGRILNEKTARSQFYGGMVWAIGMALEEEMRFDPGRARVVNADLAEYHVPVNADVPALDVIMVEEEDPHVNLIGAKGIGEIGITGLAPAIANAVYHATGKRIRELPITLDKLL